jgi:uncharacterized repeat protein (TIGR01451 family)
MIAAMRLLALRASALLAALGIVLAVVPGAGAAERSFSKRFGTTARGDIRLVGNVLTTCPDSHFNCAAERAGTNGTFTYNNGYAMVRVDVDSDPSTFNSSRATLDLPAGATVRFAGLYWGGTRVGAPTVAARGTVLVDPPGVTGYTAVSAANLDDLDALAEQHYAAAADVTAQVAAAGEGEYTVGNVQAGTGANAVAGWALVVAYEAPSEPLRNLSVFDGALLLFNASGPETETETVDGFRTPEAGPVRTRVGAVSYEGETGAGATGDQLQVDGTAIGDALNPTTDFFNSSITQLGTRFSNKSPDQVNQIGSHEIDLVAAEDVLANGSTSANVTFSSSTGDGIFPQALTFATEVQEPLVALTKAVVDLNGGDVVPGDVLEYTVTATNSGSDTAEDLTFSDPLPAATAFVPGSIVVAGASASDAADGDAGELSGSTVIGRVTALATGAVTTLSFRVRVSDSATPGITIVNTASATYGVPDSSLTRSAESNPSSVTVGAAPARPPQCSDGIDNDGDSTVDAADPGCLGGAADDDESDESLRDLSLCGRRQISLVRADVRGSRVVLSGLVAASLQGERVTISDNLGSASKVLTSVSPNASGEFVARVKRPPARLFNKIRYQARVATFRSVALKLPQSLETRSVRRVGDVIEVRGQVKRELLGPRREPVVVKRLLCGALTTVGSARPNRRGAYVVRFAAPAGSDAALYRAETKVRPRPGSRRLVRQFARAVGIVLNSQTG